MTLDFTIVEGTPTDKNGKYVDCWNDYKAGYRRLYTDGIGTCLSIALYDPDMKKGALAHIGGIRAWDVPKEVYPENIVNTLLSELGKYTLLEAFLAGESRRLEKISPQVKRDLTNLNIPIIGEDLGDSGTHQGRAVSLDCITGELTVYRLPSLF